VTDSGFDVRQALEQVRADQVMVQPFITDEGLEMMEWLSRRPGLRITLVVDDLWTNLPGFNPVRSMMPPNVPDRLRYAASLSHGLVLTTEALRARLEIEHPHTRVINNALPSWIWKPLAAQERQRGRRPRIGWAGAPQHAGDLAFLETVLARTRHAADWVFLGMCPEALRPLVTEFHEMRPFTEYPPALAGLKIDIGIAPLADHPFNRCKSHLKILEYGALGIPVVASDLEPYRDCPVVRATPNDPNDWADRILEWVGSPEKAVAHGEELRDWVMQNHMLENRIPLWSAALGVESDEE
jgi:hypothetical protein